MDIAWSSDFSYEYLRDILNSAKRNFQFHLFCELPEVLHQTTTPKLFLRHDIDLDLNKALEMAIIENQLGICATYMVMLNSPCYDIEDERSRSILKQLLSMGHEIGLHFDISNDQKINPDISINSVELDIYRDIKRLEEIIHSPVQSISFHRPLSQFLKGPLKIANKVNAYSNELMTWYLSDSAGRWREGEPVPKLLKPKGELLQLLIHPIWWGEQHIIAPDRLEIFFQSVTAGKSPQQIESFDKALGLHLEIRRSGIKNDIELKHLPESGEFNKDEIALKQRIESHDKFGNNDLNKWIFQHLEIKTGASVLDIGCGTGKQSIPAAQLTGANGHVLAFDASQNALDILETEARKLGVDKRMLLKCGDLDELEKYLQATRFDNVIGSFSLYYAKEPKSVFETVYQNLNTNGIFFFCGPSKENNAELKRFHNALPGSKERTENRSARFMEDIGPVLTEALFSKVEYFTFENSLQFDSADALYSYWSSYNLYDKSIDAVFKNSAVIYFQTHDKFETVKRVIGIKATK